MNTVSAEIVAHVKEIEKRINDEPGFEVNKVSLFGDVPCHVFFIRVGGITGLTVMHMFNITANLPSPDDAVASLRDEYHYAF